MQACIRHIWNYTGIHKAGKQTNRETGTKADYRQTGQQTEGQMGKDRQKQISRHAARHTDRRAQTTGEQLRESWKYSQRFSHLVAVSSHEPQWGTRGLPKKEQAFLLWNWAVLSCGKTTDMYQVCPFTMQLFAAVSSWLCPSRTTQSVNLISLELTNVKEKKTYCAIQLK